MDLRCNPHLGSSYKAKSQIARVVTEEWCGRELYCVACDSEHVSRSRVNIPAIDFRCPKCDEAFQLKSVRNWNSSRIVDAAYDSMVRAIRTDSTPNLLVLNYSPNWTVQRLLLIPRFVFSETALEKRKPLHAGARRAGWVGCNILLGKIPPDGRIDVISDGCPISPPVVRERFDRVRRLGQLSPALRGWTLDVLNAIQKVGKSEFSLGEVYGFENELSAAHPVNKNIRPKIRQQLQVLRDLGFVEFGGSGQYRLRLGGS